MNPVEAGVTLPVRHVLGMHRGVWSGAGDLLEGKPLSEIVEGAKETYLSSLAGQEEGILTDISEDPTVLPSAALGGATVQAAKPLGSIVAGTLGGLAGGTTSGLARPIVRGEIPEAGGVIKEAGMGALTGGGLSAAGKTLQGLGQKMLGGVLKPSKRLANKGFDAETSAKKLSELGYIDRPKSLGAINREINNDIGKIGAQYDEILQPVRGERVNIAELLLKTDDQFEGLFNQLKEVKNKKSIRKAFESYADDLEDLMDDNGDVSVQQLLNFRRTLGDDAKFQQGLTDEKRTGIAKFAKKLYSNINETLAENYPQVRKLDARMSDLLNLDEVTDEAIRRVGNNAPIDPFTVLSGIGAGGFGSIAGGEGAAIGGVLGAGASKFLRSTPGATTVENLGKAVNRASLAEALGRGAVFGPQEAK